MADRRRAAFCAVRGQRFQDGAHPGAGRACAALAARPAGDAGFAQRRRSRAFGPARRRLERPASVRLMRLLLLTLYAPIGGVPATTQAFASALRALGHDVTIAFAVYRSVWPHLSVRPWQIAFRRPRVEAVDYLGFPGVAVGAYVPELEWCRYLPHSHWRRLMAEYDACVAVL